MTGAAYELDGASVSAERFYAIACDPQRSVVVEACAGAGKTWMLVARMLRALLDGAEPAQILAITFTRKAAGEMRSRLDELLRHLAFADAEERIAELTRRGLPVDQARVQAAQLDTLADRVLESERGVQVHTFHSWFAQLLRAAPLQLLERAGLGPDAELVEDPVELVPLAWRALLQAAQADARLQEDFGTQVRLRGRHRTREWLVACIGRRIEIELADRAGTLEDSVPDVDLHGLDHPARQLDSAPWRAALQDLALELASAKGKLARDAGAALGVLLAEPDAVRRFERLWPVLFTDDGTPRKQLGDLPALASVQDGLAELADVLAQFEARAEHLRMVRLSREMLRCYAQVKRERGLADMNDLEHVALTLLRDEPLAAWVHERLDVRVRHLLVDEFQDTSPLQWQALHAWLASYAGAGGGASGQRPLGVFIVGDPKQSIYRFRRAEPRVFGAARDFVREGLQGHVLNCDHTRRNARGVLEVVNGCFAALQSRQSFAGFRRHTTAASRSGTVWALPAVPRPLRVDEAEGPDEPWRDSLATPRIVEEEALRDREAAQAAAAIAALVAQGIPPGEIHVLARKRVSLLPMAHALEQLGIAHAAPEAMPLAESWVARDLTALLDLLASPHHDLALAQVLRSPIFRAGDDDLMQLARQRRSSWWHALQDPAVTAASPRLASARESLQRWQSWAVRLPPHDLLQRIVTDGDLRARYAAATPPPQVDGVLDQLDGVLAQALWLGGARYATPYNFTRSLRRRSLSLPQRPHPQAVQLLTVHGAKGLEADVVFVLDASAAGHRAENEALLVDWPVESPAPRRCAFVASEARCPPALRELLAAENLERNREELNALYVAMTRARCQLVFSRIEPARREPAQNWWSLVQDHGVQPWPAPDPAGGRQALWSPAARPVPRQDIVLAELPRVEGPAANRCAEALPAAVQAQQDGIAAVGTAVHRALEWITRHPAARRGAAQVRRAVEQAAAQASVPAAEVAHVQKVVNTILASAELAALLDPQQLHWAGNEVAVAWRGESLRIDRLVAQRTLWGLCWWVLDYKLLHTPDQLAAYREQLLRYRDAVRASVGGDEVRAAFVTGAGRLVELPPA